VGIALLLAILLYSIYLCASYRRNTDAASYQDFELDKEEEEE